MKKNYFIYIVLILIIIVSSNTFSQGKLEQGLRYLKLGNTHRELKNYNQSEIYLQKAQSMIPPQNYYWRGATSEFFGYLYRDMGNIEKARLYFVEAERYYKLALKGPSDGSHNIIDVDKLLNKKSKTPNGIGDSNCQPIQNQYVFTTLSEAKGEDYETVERLNLEGQELTDFPKEILKMTNLKELNISNTGLSEIPEKIGNLEFLQEIYLDGNDLVKLPKSMDNLKCLRLLSIKSNSIQASDLLRLQKKIPGLQILADIEED